MVPAFSIEAFAEAPGNSFKYLKGGYSYFTELSSENLEDAENRVVWWVGEGGNTTTTKVSITNTVELDLHGCVISGVSFYVESTGRLTITDSCSQTAVHYYEYSSTHAWVLSDSAINKGEAITIGAISSDTTEGTLVAVSGGAIYGGSFSSNVYIGGIYNAGIVTLSGINMIGNKIFSGGVGGGAVLSFNGTTNVINTNIVGNHSDKSGGGIYNINGTCNITGSSISNNVSDLDGGGICNAGTCNITDSKINYNIASSTSDSDGGGIYNAGTCNITDSIIEYNTSKFRGGGIYNYGENGICNVTHSTISYNTARMFGGGIFNYDATCNIESSTISYNTSKFRGGGIYYSTGTCNIISSTISYNKAVNYAGVFVNKDSFVLSGICNILDNTESGSGTKSNLVIYNNKSLLFDDFDSSSEIYVTCVDSRYSVQQVSFTADLSEASGTAYFTAFHSDLDSYKVVTMAGTQDNTVKLATKYITEACIMDGTGYETINAALNSVTDSSQKTITLSKNVTESIEIASNKSIKLDLAGYTLSNNNCSQVIKNRGNLTIVDSSSDKTGTIKSEVMNTEGQIILNDVGALLDFQSGTIYSHGSDSMSGPIRGIYNEKGTMTFAGIININQTNVNKVCGISGGTNTVNIISAATITVIGNSSASGFDSLGKGKILGNTTITVSNPESNYVIEVQAPQDVTVEDGSFVGLLTDGGFGGLEILGGKYSDDPSSFVASGYTANAVSEAPYLYCVSENAAPQGSYSNVVYYNHNTCLKGYSCVLTRFNDVVNTAWYHDGLHYCVERGYMQGYDLVTFGPNDMLSRSMVVRMLWNAEGTSYTYTSTTYTDAVAGSWYYSALAWAEACKVVDGYGDGTFGVNDNITREQFAKMLYTYAKYKGYDVSKTAELTYPDAKDVSSWAKDAVVWANAEGIIQGKDTGLLDPKGYASRAEAATMLMRLLTMK